MAYSHTLAGMSDGEMKINARFDRRWLWLFAVAAAVLLAAAITFATGAGIGADHRRADAAGEVSFGAPSPKPVREVRGSMRLPLAPGWKIGDPCSHGNGYDDVTTGTQITITDASGKALSVATLAQGKVVDDAKYPGLTKDCLIPFQTTVPPGVGPYGFTIGRHGTVRFDEAQLTTAELSLG